MNHARNFTSSSNSMVHIFIYALKERFRSFKLIFTFFILLTVLMNLSQFAEATVQVELELYDITDNEKPREVDVAPGRSGSVTYHGLVVLTRYPPSTQQVIVTFDPIDAGGGWGGSVIPPQISFSYSPIHLIQYHNISVSVKAPPMELMSAKRNINITGRWMLSPGIDTGEVIPFTLTVAVKHYYLFTIKPIDEYIKVWPSQPAKFELAIKNYGNANDEFRIEVEPADIPVLEKAGFVIEIKHNSIWVPPREERNFSFTVHGPQRNFHIWKNRISMIPIRVTTAAPLSGEPEVTSTMSRVWMVAYYEVGTFIPDPCLIIIVIGIIVIVILVILRKKGKLRRRKRKWKKK